MKVLVLEDQATASTHAMEYIKNKAKHEPILAKNIKDAERILDGSKIDCIIADTNMPADGLTPKEQELSELGKFTGWLWLSGHVFPKFPHLKSRTIIYTGYLDDLRGRFGEELKGIRLVDKRPSRGGIKELHRNLNEIAAEIGGAADG